MPSATLDQAWVAASVTATADRAGSGLYGTAEFKLSDGSVGIEVEDGRIVGTPTGTADVLFPLTDAQVGAYLAGELDLSVAYMKGDLKPEGSTAAIVCVLEVMGWLHSNG